jgi:hypothetical protein
MSTSAENPTKNEPAWRRAAMETVQATPKPPRPKKPWWLKAALVVEWSACVLAILLGGLFLYFELSYSDVDASWDSWLVVLGLALVVLGPLNVGLTLWLSSSIPLSGRQRTVIGFFKALFVLLLLPLLLLSLFLVFVVAVFAIYGFGQVFPGVE